VAGKKGTASAVLIRALEPLPSMEKIFKGKGKRIASGPGRLTKAMNITKAQQGIDVTYPKSELIIVEGKKEFSIASSHRIGVREDLPQKLRFYIKDNEFVSK
jgi:DNA-3-methyladenine glycosylase